MTSVLVKDTEKIFSLTSEVEALQVCVTGANTILISFLCVDSYKVKNAYLFMYFYSEYCIMFISLVSLRKIRNY